METTRGDSPRRPDYSRAGEASRLARVIRQTLRGGGSVLMPVFALGKSQEALVMLHELTTAGQIPAAPIFLGGLSLKLTRIYDESQIEAGPESRTRLLKEVPQTQFSSRPRKGAASHLHPISPRCHLRLSSGMMTENTLSNDFAFGFLNNPKNSLLFVGYADPDSPGGRIKVAPPGYPVRLNEHRPPVDLKCRVESFDFSGHADRETLRAYANQLKPKRIILVHGELPALESFEQTLKSDMPAPRSISPGPISRSRWREPEKDDGLTGGNGGNREATSWSRRPVHFMSEAQMLLILFQPPEPLFSLLPPVQIHLRF